VDPKKCDRTRYVELVFLCLVGSTGHVVRTGAFGTRNVDAQFFMIWWARCGSHKKHARTRHTEVVFFIWWDLRVT
jgi:hypothetical protein